MVMFGNRYFIHSLIIENGTEPLAEMGGLPNVPESVLSAQAWKKYREKSRTSRPLLVPFIQSSIKYQLYQDTMLSSGDVVMN